MPLLHWLFNEWFLFTVQNYLCGCAMLQFFFFFFNLYGNQNVAYGVDTANHTHVAIFQPKSFSNLVSFFFFKHTYEVPTVNILHLIISSFISIVSELFSKHQTKTWKKYWRFLGGAQPQPPAQQLFLFLFKLLTLKLIIPVSMCACFWIR